MIVTFWENLLNPAGIERDVPWVELVNRLSRREAFRGDKEHPGWSPARFVPCRRARDAVKSVFALCLDYDNGAESIDALARRIGAEAGGLVHTTRKSTAEAPRLRVVLPLSRPVSAFEFDELWKRVAPWAGQVDRAARDPSRFWFLPGVIGENPFELREFGGDNLDVDKWLAKPDPEARRAEPLPAAPRTDVFERAMRYVAKMPSAISGQGGHAATWEVAVVLARGFGLSEDDTLRGLQEFNLRCEPQWSEKELRHKAKGAFESTRLSRGYLLNDSRDWRAGSYQIPEEPPPPVEEFDPSESDYNEPERIPGDDTEEIERDKGKGKPAAEQFNVVELRALCFEVVETAKTAGPQRGLTTGVKDLDDLLNGLRPEHVTLVAAGTSVGKSSLGIMVADENLRLSEPVLIVSVEDSRLMYGKRLMARRAGVNALRLRNNTCTQEDIEKLERAASQAQAIPFFMSGIGKSVEWCAQGIRAMCAEHGVKLVICDYIQRFRTAKFSGDRRNQVTYVASVLSDAIKESKAAGILISQLKRIEGREPTMDDVKESGDLENMAEHVVLGWTELGGKPYHEGEEPPKRRFIKVPKNKDGPTMDSRIELQFEDLTASFKAMTESAHAADREREDEWSGFADRGYHR